MLTCASPMLHHILLQACAFDEFERVSSQGETLDDFKAAVCQAIRSCTAGEEFQTKAPTKTADRTEPSTSLV